MVNAAEELIRKAYTAFNSRNIDAALLTMHADVDWPNGWEGGYVKGQHAVRDYWTRQWQALDPYVYPVAIQERPDGKLEVEVHQIVKDLQGATQFDGMVKHIYTIEGGSIRKMEIEKD